MAKKKKKVSTTQQVMSKPLVAPITATALGTAAAGILVWIANAIAGQSVTVPAEVQGWMSALISTYIWYKMPVEWEAK